MFRTWLLTIVTGFLAAQVGLSQSVPWQFRWQQGQVLTYRVEHATAAAEVTKDGKSDSKTKLSLTKQWQVLDVDARGVATMRLSLQAMRLETTTPSGSTLLFDSANPDKSDPHMREELGKFVGEPLAVLRIDGYGRVLEVKESRHAPASRFETELPFGVVLPAGAPQPGQGWHRDYKITIDPPQGTGEKYDAVQQFTCKQITQEGAAIAVATALKKEPEAAADRIPLLQNQPEGSIVFDILNGRLRSVQFRIDKTLTGHQGEGSNYHFESTYTEQLVDRP
jgi:hypothetical protein